MTRIAAIQLTSSTNISKNLQQCALYIEQAVAEGAELIVLPENFALMGQGNYAVVHAGEEVGKGLIQDFLALQSQKHKVWLVGGSVPLKLPSVADKVYSASLVYNAAGECVARYDKIHLFDVSAAENEHYHESKHILQGEQPVVVDTPFGRLGLAICYDVRFPELFRYLLDQKADILCIPAAFTHTTGQVHWDILLRCRAIENLSYVVAAAQVGQHENGRNTYGHSMIIDPWGKVLNCQPHGTGVICADTDPNYLHHIRTTFPALQHRKIQCQTT